MGINSQSFTSRANKCLCSIKHPARHTSQHFKNKSARFIGSLGPLSQFGLWTVKSTMSWREGVTTIPNRLPCIPWAVHGPYRSQRECRRLSVTVRGYVQLLWNQLSDSNGCDNVEFLCHFAEWENCHLQNSSWIDESIHTSGGGSMAMANYDNFPFFVKPLIKKAPT